MEPVAVSIPYCDPLRIFACLVADEWAILLDSSDWAQQLTARNRYSYIVVDPLLGISWQRGLLSLQASAYPEPEWQACPDIFSYLQRWLCSYPTCADPRYPPFQGGWVGYFAYDLCHLFEPIARPACSEMPFPDCCGGLYDSVISFDHQLKCAMVLSHGLTMNVVEQSLSASKVLAAQKVARIVHRLSLLPPRLSSACQLRLAERDITSNFSALTYQQAVQRVQHAIRRGDVFEVNLSQRFAAMLPAGFSAMELYARLRLLNPAPFSAFLHLPGQQYLASTSPERLLLLTAQGQVETRPIKGTAPRGNTPAEDEQAAQRLKQSRKDCAENIMIVDLMRNDLSKVCADHSIVVSQLCGVESFAQVHHLVSVIHGQLSLPYHALDLLRAVFPGGSVTGAPKVQAMQLIAVLEGIARGPYCGSIAYLGFDGRMDTSILIRTCCLTNTDRHQQAWFQAGGAVVLTSDPEEEYIETLHKAKVFYQALTQVVSWSC